MADLAPLTYGTVTGRFLAIAADTADGGVDPDYVAMGGTVTLTPNLPFGLVLNAVPVPTTILPRPIIITLDANGQINWNGDTFVKLLATNDPSVNPTGGWTYTASFSLVLDGETIPYGPFDFQLPAGTTVDLTTVAPVASSPGVITIAGPIGPTGPAGTVGAMNSATTPPAFTIVGSNWEGTAATFSYAPGSNATRGTILFATNNANTVGNPQPGGRGWTGFVTLTGTGDPPTFMVLDANFSNSGTLFDRNDNGFYFGDWGPSVWTVYSAGSWTMRIGYEASDRTNFDGGTYRFAISYFTTNGL